MEVPPRQNAGLDNIDIALKIVVSHRRQPYFGIIYYHAPQDDSLETEPSPMRNACFENVGVKI
eukprot:16448471-Heterocapsa_arctica.AAC.1